MKRRIPTRAVGSRKILQRCVLYERRARLSSMHSRTLRQLLCNQSAARGFSGRVTRKPEEAPAVLQRDNDFANDALNVRNFAPRHAEIESATEFQPATCQQQMAVLVDAPAAKADRRCKMALVAGRQRVWRFDDRQIPLSDAVGKLG
jgi:hypothetical protein